ncbi:Serine/threonine-protein kinase mrk1 [Saccharomyces pastorianus]|uniref:Serine/threonine-protein kinase mrk1 n=1 Tax=Saccharomyces pastorianus TaxID=27292 RepID=A0A6C1DN31_SACPS|nr:Serine/threonine-protein kinase mrk1 [Saccharomyces pastorianus]
MTDVLRSLVRKISFNNSDNLQLKHKTSIQSNTALEKKKRKPDTIKKVSDVQVHHTVPNFNNSSEYINDIENLIISKLIDGGKEVLQLITLNTPISRTVKQMEKLPISTKILVASLVKRRLRK